MDNLPVSKLSDNLSDLWKRAQAASRRNHYELAIRLLNPLLREAPGFLEGRKFLRENQLKFKQKLTFSDVMARNKISHLIKKSPEKALVQVELVLEKSPNDIKSNNLLYVAAMAGGLPHTASFALEEICRAYPKQSSYLHKLGKHYTDLENYAKAVEIYKKITKLKPSDAEAVKNSKDLAAKASMKETNLEDATSIKNILKDSAEAQALEASGRIAATADQLEDQLVISLKAFEKEGKTLAKAKEVAKIYERLKNWKEAEIFYIKAFDLSKNDLSLQNQALLMKQQGVEAELEEVKSQLEKTTEDKKLKTKFDTLRKQQLENEIALCQKRVDANPTDLALRLALAQAFYDIGDNSAALPNLQKAEGSPHLKTKVLLLKAKVFESKGMSDMAIKQLEEAIEKLSTMDETKKEVVYQLGDLQFKRGNKKEALIYFKEIYEVDYGYRDVSKRVESTY